MKIHNLFGTTSDIMHVMDVLGVNLIGAGTAGAGGAVSPQQNYWGSN